MSDGLSDAIRDAERGVYLSIHVQPGAKRTAFCGMHDGCLKIAIAQSPQDGRANEALRGFVASEFGLGKRDVELASGATSRRKRLFLAGVPAALRQAIINRVSDV